MGISNINNPDFHSNINHRTVHNRGLKHQLFHFFHGLITICKAYHVNTTPLLFVVPGCKCFVVEWNEQRTTQRTTQYEHCACGVTIVPRTNPRCLCIEMYRHHGTAWHYSLRNYPAFTAGLQDGRLGNTVLVLKAFKTRLHGQYKSTSKWNKNAKDVVSHANRIVDLNWLFLNVFSVFYFLFCRGSLNIIAKEPIFCKIMDILLFAYQINNLKKI